MNEVSLNKGVYMKRMLMISIIILTLVGACGESEKITDLEERIKILESEEDISMMEMMSTENAETKAMMEMMEQRMGERNEQSIIVLQERVKTLEEINKELMDALPPTFESISRDINSLSKRIDQLEK